MKKLSLLFIITVVTVGALNLTAFAANFFTDENNFESWYAESAKNMEYNKIMTGYPDGSFRGENEVTRSELAVTLDRFAENIVEKELANGSTLCTDEYVHGLTLKLYDQYGKAIEGAKISTNPSSKEFEYSSIDQKYRGLGREKGYVTFKIEKEGYTSHSETIKLETDICHVIPQEKTVVLIKKV